MSMAPISYKQLDKVLRELGFSRHRVEPKWLRYDHAASHTTIILAEKPPTELVRPTDAASAWRHLVEKGLMSEDEIEAVMKR